jgi:hypothetical protein
MNRRKKHIALPYATAIELLIHIWQIYGKHKKSIESVELK